jgi:hypothetical protein
MLTKINSSKTDKINFGTVPVKDLKQGKKYLLNSHFFDPALRGTERLYTKVQKMVGGRLDVAYKNLKTGATGGYEYVAEEVEKGELKFLDYIV